MTNFLVGSTEERIKNDGEYLVQMSATSARNEFGSDIPTMVAVTYTNMQLNGVEIAAPALLQILPDKKFKSNGSIALLDQTIRQCLGMTTDYQEEHVSVHRLSGFRKLPSVISKIVGRRIICCRPAILQPLDIEKDIVRLDHDAMAPIGVSNGDSIVVSGVSRDSKGNYTLNSQTITAIVASKDYKDFYDAASIKEDMKFRYINIEKMLNQPDLHKIYMDADLRLKLFGNEDRRSDIKQTHSEKEPIIKITQCAQPVFIYRSPMGALAHELGNMGTVFAAMLAFFLVFVTNNNSIVVSVGSAIALFVSFIVGLSTVIWKTRTIWRS